MLQAGKKSFTSSLHSDSGSSQDFKVFFSPIPPWLSHDGSFCEQLRENFCYTTGMLGPTGSEILAFSA